MFDSWHQILTSTIAVFSAGGWFLSKHQRNIEREKHEAEIERARAESDAIRQKNEIDYTKNLLEIYSAHIIQPLKDEIDTIKKNQKIYESAVAKTIFCSVYPNCPVFIELQNQIENLNTNNKPA